MVLCVICDKTPSAFAPADVPGSAHPLPCLPPMPAIMRRVGASSAMRETFAVETFVSRCTHLRRQTPRDVIECESGAVHVRAQQVVIIARAYVSRKLGVHVRDSAVATVGVVVVALIHTHAGLF